MQKDIQIYFSALLMIIFISCNEKTKKDVKENKTDFTLLTYGLPNMERQNSNYIIAKKWGITFYPVAGCVVTEELQDSVNTINTIVNKNIENKYGKKWREKFEREVDAEFEKEKIVSEIIDNVSYIKKKDKEMELEGNGLHYSMAPKENADEYKVSVQGWGKINKKDEWVTYYKMNVNYKTKEVKLISDKIVLE
jgi:hypothetical protein